MKRSYELLNPPAAVKLALGELIVKFARLTLRRPLSLRSSLELGTLFCEVLNDKTTTPRMTHGTLVDVSDACEQVNINANGFMCLSKAILEDAEPNLKVSDDDLAQNPDLLERLADAVFKVKKNGLESVFTPGLEKKMIEASEKFKGLLSFFKSTESQNITRQIMLGDILMNMALCKERQNEPLQSMIFYLRAQSVFGGLIDIEDSKQRYQECDKKILELEGTIGASMSTCKREV